MLKKVDIQAGRVALNLSPSMAVKTAEQPSLCQIPYFSPWVLYSSENSDSSIWSSVN